MLVIRERQAEPHPPYKPEAIPKTAPAILDHLNLSPELWLHAAEHFGRFRSVDRMTPASRFNAEAQPARHSMLVQQAESGDMEICPGKLRLTFWVGMAPIALLWKLFPGILDGQRHGDCPDVT